MVSITVMAAPTPTKGHILEGIPTASITGPAMAVKMRMALHKLRRSISTETSDGFVLCTKIRDVVVA